ncbi:four-carbon acid sugar kinase family protein [Rhizobium sp. NRK18]|uniref:four-carbon acid sugar kinase family protein n=1 Tax=Rhizobium sp. NRK18 TaxID=2964667 RepID=UPI0021C37B66|nr:four-carbon acid sugar kinase family protein [Rhizobium sp. NRK18]MCQ2006060.1 four-carbon acid sugar kinase family protein [Rhizobium sp. NRK18]
MTRLLIIADDLTGALDSAVPFAARGLKTMVARRPEDLESLLHGDVDVAAVSTASREGSEADARRAVARIGALVRAMAAPAPRLFKKVDSRLKGHVAAEVEEVARLGGASRAIVCPAIPTQARTVVAGFLRGRGVLEPIDIAARLAGSGLSIKAPDAADKADLARIVAEAGKEDLLVGAAGLALALADEMAPADATDRRAPRLAAPALLACGSRDPITLAQLERLRAVARPNWIEAPNGTLPDDGDPAVRSLTVLQMTAGAAAIDGHEAGHNFSASVCRLTQQDIRSLLCCGGETADAVLGASGVGVITLVGELSPGVPAGMVRLGDKNILLATKSGGFGDVDCLLQIAEDIDFPNACEID